MKQIIGKAAFNRAISRPGVVVVDFKAKWCGPCKRLLAIFKRMERAFGKMVSFYTVDINVKKNAVLSKLENVDSIPHVCFYKNGKKKECVVGLYPVDYYNDIFSKLL